MLLRGVQIRARQAIRRHVLDAVDERGLVQGVRFEFVKPSVCRIQRFEEAMPGPSEVLIETLTSVVSRGTETAEYLRLENVAIEYPHVPGYSQAGRVVAVGSNAGLQKGQLVFSPGSHASVFRCEADRALAIPHGVSPEAAALTQIGFIALQGIRRAGIVAGERVVVLGCGLVGQLVAQLAQIAGAEVLVVARSGERLAVAQHCGVREILQATDRVALENLRADVVIDATGAPQALPDACCAASTGGRVVLVGSSRGITHGVDLEALGRKGLQIIGAHTSGVPRSEGSAGLWTWRRECETFLGFLARGRLRVAPLLTRRVSPGEAPAVYRDLARAEDKSVGVYFDWTRPGPWRARIEVTSPLRLAAAGLRRVFGGSAPMPSFLAPRADGRVLRFGLIGCGEIAAESAAALRAASNCTVTHTADPESELARSLAAATGAAWTTEVDELLASVEVDAVLISTPHHLHASLTIRAAQAGKHVIVEKPMATSVEDCDRMISAADEYGVVLSICYCQRFDPRVQRARRLIEQGILGDLFGTRISFAQDRPVEYWTHGLTGRTANDWRARREMAGGGVLIMNACHVLDYVSWIAGSEVTAVAACAATLAQPVEVEDTIALSYRYASGAVGTLEATTAIAGPGSSEQILRGRNGQLVVGPTLKFWSRRTVDGYESGRWHTVMALPRPAERRHYFESFAEAVLEGHAPPVTAREARTIQAVIQAAYMSSEEGRLVPLSELFCKSASLARPN